VEPIIRQGLQRFTDMTGKLWISLADYYIRKHQFDKARDIYEEAVKTVMTVRDFGQVFDVYAEFEEQLITLKIESRIKSGKTPANELDLQLRLKRFEKLMQKRPLLLNSVLLRQNPHNVNEWLKRVKLFEGRPREVVNTFTEAVKTVDPKLATGKLSLIWTEFAKFYEDNNQLKEARVIFDKAVLVPYVKVEELATVWCNYVEMELRHECYNEALSLLKTVTKPPPHKPSYYDRTETVQNRVYRSVKLWALYADLEDSLGTFNTTKDVYYKILDLRIATPQIVLNFSELLEEKNYFEESFKVYERGVAMFKWPLVFDLWTTYLTKFVGRYGGDKLERARDLFEQALEKCPEDYAKSIYLLYAKLEEDYGLKRHAMNVYNRATQAVKKVEQAEMYQIYINRATACFGVTHTRQIYEQALETLPDNDSRSVALQFAELETKLGEIDRARSIYNHGSQFADPRHNAEFWRVWQSFEVSHGNEDTFREMLRIKRSVKDKYSTQASFNVPVITPGETAPADPMAALQKDVMFVRGSESAKTADTVNPDEIDIGEEEEEEEEEEDGEPEEEVPVTKRGEIVKQCVPDAVFGKLAEQANKENEEENEEEAS